MKKVNLDMDDDFGENLQEMFKTLAAIKEQIKGPQTKKAKKEVFALIESNYAAMTYELQKMSHSCYEKTQSVRDLANSSLAVEVDSVFDKDELRKFLARGRKSHPEMMKKYDSLPNFHFGECPQHLVGKTSKNAQLVETDKYYYYG